MQRSGDFSPPSALAQAALTALVLAVVGTAFGAPIYFAVWLLS